MSEQPRFASPAEELQFLRSRVIEQEQKLEAAGASVNRDEVIKQEIHEFKADHMHGGNVSAPHVEQFEAVPEESQLKEALALVNEKGILTALAAIEKVGNWKLEDDFHNELVCQIREGLPHKNLKEKGPMYRALKMTLFEVIIPEKNSKENGGLSSIVSSMEQFYAGMLSVSEKETLGKNYFVLEIANGEGSEEFVFYVSVPTEKKMLFEKNLLSVFPEAKLIERERDYNIFGENSVSVASCGTLSASRAYPIKTYEEFDHDPLNLILNSFSKIPKNGAGAAIQIIFNPRGDEYTKIFTKNIEELEKGKKAKDVLRDDSVVEELARDLGKFLLNKKKDENEPKEVDSRSIELIRKKLLSPSVDTNIRIAVSAPSMEEATSIISDIESGFNQFEAPGINSLKFTRVKEKNKGSFFRNFSFRLFENNEQTTLNLKELTSIFHFHTEALHGRNELRQSKAGRGPAPLDLPSAGTRLGTNLDRGRETPIYFTQEDRLRHFYVIGQTGTGKSTLLKNMIIEDMKAGNGVCFIDPHGSDVETILAHVPQERLKDVIYFDPAYVERPMALNMLEYDRRFPEQKTFVVNEMLSIFNKLFDMKTAGGPMFEQYFRNAVLLVIDDPDSGNTLVDVSRVLSSAEFRALKLSKCTNPLVVSFWTDVASKAGGEAALTSIVPYIVSKFDNFLSNDIMRPVIAQEKSSFNFREVMDEKKILLVNLSKGRLGELNSSLIGLILVGKILMSALSRADSYGKDFPPFYLYIDEFQNVTTDSIAQILSEARKYKLSLNVAHQFIKQLDEKTRDAVFGNVGSLAVFRVGAEDAEYLEKQLSPVFSAKDIQNIDNLNAYLKLLVKGVPVRPFDIKIPFPDKGTLENVEMLKNLSYEKYGGDRVLIEQLIMKKYEKAPKPL